MDAFHFMAIGQLFLTYPSRHTWIRPLADPYLHASVVGGVAIQFAAASLPVVSKMLGDATMPVELWTAVCVGAFVAWGGSEAIARVVWRNGEAGVSR